MTVYERPPLYAVSHLAFGFTAVWYPLIGFLALMYQIGQLVYNVRVFPMEGKILPGNSVSHTAVKLGEMVIGYVLGLFVKSGLGKKKLID
jgi:hypothetical protein